MHGASPPRSLHGAVSFLHDELVRLLHPRATLRLWPWGKALPSPLRLLAHGEG